ncbi:hypothetical protein BKD30_06155 [Tersicoccus phoenicis]|uniref:5-oxoprolinase subunit A n=1 Tax=Tersicoccus phoenicis TaxID=554083 RepID=A0A1R1LD51_9MICC|nr:5-oxoprolinase subunit PxpA [Tersicoccus phoenicis]OMH25472.1 hypothetical protein BKD30_06155 [Tersicoccus phoenicis]
MDLNCDLGESFGAWTMGDDEAMFTLVTSVNVACGFHAGDPRTMLRSCRLAGERGVTVGAHVAYRDLAGFGRRRMDVAPDELTADVLYQLAALDGVARATGVAVRYVKPHGALYNTIAVDESQARAVLAGVRLLDPGLPILGLPASVIEAVCADAGHPFVREAFVDRAYTPGGSLVSRREAGAVLHDVDAIAERAVEMARDGVVTAVDGTVADVQPRSLCVHSDTPGAVAMATAVREALTAAGIDLAAFA